MPLYVAAFKVRDRDSNTRLANGLLKSFEDKVLILATLNLSAFLFWSEASKEWLEERFGEFCGDEVAFMLEEHQHPQELLRGLVRCAEDAKTLLEKHPEGS